MSASSRTTRSGTRSHRVSPRTPQVTTTAQLPPTAESLPPSSNPPIPDFDTATFLLPSTPFADLPCMSEGSLGAAPFCDPARVYTGDGVLCSVSRHGDLSTRMELSFRLCPLVATLPPLAGEPDFLTVMTQAEATEQASQGSAAFRRTLALSDMVESATKLALVAGLLKASRGCVILLTVDELREPSVGVGEGPVQPGGVGAAAGGARGTAVPTKTSTTVAGNSGSGVQQGSEAVNPDDAAFVDLFTSPHDSHEVRLQ